MALITTHLELATRIGVSRQRVSTLIRARWWAWGRGPWTEDEADEIADTLAERRRVCNAAPGRDSGEGTEPAERRKAREEGRAIDREIAIERLQLMKIQRGKSAGEWVKADEAEAQAIAGILAVRAKLQEIPQRAALLAHKSEADITATLKTWMAEVGDFYARGGN